MIPQRKQMRDETMGKDQRKLNFCKLNPTSAPMSIDDLFPAIAKWIRTNGHIEIGDQDGVGFIVRALDYGGLVFEDRKSKTLAQALSALEAALEEPK